MDRHTLFSTQATLLLFLGVGVLLSRRAYRWKTPDNSAVWFAVGYILGGIGLWLQSYRDLTTPILSSPFITIVMGNFLFFLLMPCLSRAYGAMTQQDTRRPAFIMASLNLLTMLTFAFFTFVRPNIGARTVEACAILMVMVVTNIVILSRSKDTVILPAVRLMMFLLGFHLFFTALRLYLLVVHRNEWFSMAGLISIVGLAITFMWIDALRLRDELEHRAMIDPLTSLFNRRALDIVATRELQSAVRRNQPCSALMIDIDQFKQINDGMGHAAGDATLCAVAGALRGCLRVSDMATRLGGDEFFILLPDADEEAAALITARIRLSVEALRLSTMGGQEFTVAVSIGQVTLHDPTATVDDLLHGSDIVLYREKQLRKARQAATRITPRQQTPNIQAHASNA